MKYSLRTLLSVVLGVACALMAMYVHVVEQRTSEALAAPPRLPRFQKDDIFEMPGAPERIVFRQVHFVTTEKIDGRWEFVYDLISELGEDGNSWWNSVPESTLVDDVKSRRLIYHELSGSIDFKEAAAAFELQRNDPVKSKGTP